MKNNSVVKLALVVLGFIIVITLAASFKKSDQRIGRFCRSFFNRRVFGRRSLNYFSLLNRRLARFFRHHF